VIGIGRVKTPTLAIVCLRELEIRDFRVEDYFEIVATANVEGGTFLMRHAPPAKARIRDRAQAEAVAKAAARHTGPLAVSVEHRRQAPPRLFDHTRRHIDPGYRAQTWCERDFEAADAAADIERGQVRLYQLPFVQPRHDLGCRAGEHLGRAVEAGDEGFVG